MRSFHAALFATSLLLSVGSSCKSDRPSNPPAPRDASTAADGATANEDAAISSDATTNADAGGQDSGSADSSVADSGVAIMIPDPGTDMDNWGNSVNDPCCSTPDTAFPVGIVTMNTGYVQGNIDASTGDFFYVLRAGPNLTQLTWSGFVPNLDLIDLHDGEGLVFEFNPVYTAQFGNKGR